MKKNISQNFDILCDDKNRIFNRAKKFTFVINKNTLNKGKYELFYSRGDEREREKKIFFCL